MAGAVVPIQRVPSGFPAPGGIDESSAAHGESGGYHTGSFCLSLISYSPVGVGYAGWPIAIGYVRMTRPLRIRRTLRW